MDVQQSTICTVCVYLTVLDFHCQKTFTLTFVPIDILQYVSTSLLYCLVKPLDIYDLKGNKTWCICGCVSWSSCYCVVYYDCLGASLNSWVCTAVRSSDTERTTTFVVVLFRFIHPEECWNRLLCVHISLPPSERWIKQRRPRSCRPWLQSLGCTGSPCVTGPLLEGIQLAKCRCSPVFNNNHLKSLQLARSYKEMDRRKMWRGNEEGLQYEIQWTFWMSAPLSHGKFKKAFVFSNY